MDLEQSIEIPAGFSSDLADMSIVRAPLKKNIVETGVYAANILLNMGSMLVTALEGQSYSGNIYMECASTQRPDVACRSAIEVKKSGKIFITRFHYGLNEGGTNDAYGARMSCLYGYYSSRSGTIYNVSINPRKNKIRIEGMSSTLLGGIFKFGSIESYFKRVEEVIADKYGPDIAQEERGFFKDFCSIPKQLGKLVEEIKAERSDFLEEVQDDYLKLNGIERKLLE